MRFSQVRRIGLTLPSAAAAAYAAADAQTMDCPRPHPRARALLFAPFLPWQWEATVTQDVILPHHQLLAGLLSSATQGGRRVIIITGSHEIAADLAVKLPALAREHDQAEVALTAVAPRKRGPALFSLPTPQIQALLDGSQAHVVLPELMITEQLRTRFDLIVLVGVEDRAWEMVRVQNSRAPVSVVVYDDTESDARYRRIMNHLRWTERVFAAANLPREAASTAA